MSTTRLATLGRAAHHGRMSILDTLKWLARDLSKVQDQIVPEHGQRMAKRYTSTPDRLAGVEVLP